MFLCPLSLSLSLLFADAIRGGEGREASQNGMAEGGGATRHAVGKEANPPAMKAIKATLASPYPPHHLAPFRSVGNVGRRSGSDRRWPRLREGGKASIRPASGASTQSYKAAARRPRRASGQQPTHRQASHPASHPARGQPKQPHQEASHQLKFRPSSLFLTISLHIPLSLALPLFLLLSKHGKV